MIDLAIETIDLTKRFGKATALDNINLQVPTGSIFAFLGRNGAGKTTTIKILLNILNRTSGSARVLGLDCSHEPLEIRRRIGYVAEAQDMYDWMSVDEIIWFCKRFYPKWDDTFTNDLKQQFDLPGKLRIRDLSRGMRGKLALLLAMAYRPELLILDEPTAGLDVVVRHDFLKGILELIQEEGRTVFFSSHHVSEVERVADWVGIVDHGELVCCLSMDDLKDSVKRVVLTFDSDPPQVSQIPGILKVKHSGRQLILTLRDFSGRTIDSLYNLGPASVMSEQLSLEEIFVSLVGGYEVGQ